MRENAYRRLLREYPEFEKKASAAGWDLAKLEKMVRRQRIGIEELKAMILIRHECGEAAMVQYWRYWKMATAVPFRESPVVAAVRRCLRVVRSVFFGDDENVGL